MQDKVDNLRERGATVHHKPGTDEASVRLEGNMLFMPLEMIEKSLAEITLNATLDCLTTTDRLMLEVFRDSHII